MEPMAVTELSKSGNPIFRPLFAYRKLIPWKNCLNITAVCAAWIYLSISTAHAGEWKVDPKVQISETFTDNVHLAPAGQEKSDLITQINPGISVQRTTSRSDLFLDYTMQNLIYANERDSNSMYHQLAARSKSEVISDFMLFDASANIAQQNVSLLAPIGVDASSASNNTAETRSYLLSPTIHDKIGSAMFYEARYQHDYVGSDSNGLSNSSADKLFFTLKNGPAFNRFGWGLNYNKEKVDYSSSEDYQTEKMSADARWSLTPRFALTGTVGREEDDYTYIGEKPNGNSWSAGILWRPSNLTSLSLSGGRRFFGATKALDFSHQSRRFFWTARYSEDLSSSRENFLSRAYSADELDKALQLSEPDPAKRADTVKLFLARTDQNFLTNQIFLQKRFDGSVIYTSGKTSYILNIFKDRRDAQTAGTVSTAFFGSNDFDFSNNILQKGANFFINWQFAPRTSVNFELSKNDTDYLSTERDDTLNALRVGLGHQFSAKTTTSINVRHLDRKSNFSSDNYKENAVIATINFHF